jgi:serine protease AprX
MDSIGPRYIQSNQSPPAEKASTPHTSEARNEAQQNPLDSISLDSLKKQLRGQDKVSLIIEAKSPQEREQLKQKFIDQNPKNRIVADLPLINGFTVEVDKNSLGVLPELSKIAGDVSVALDGRITIPDPEIEKPVKPGEMTAMLDVATKTMGLDKVWDRGFKGQNTIICVIDTGIAPHKDLKDKIIGFDDITKKQYDVQPYDDNRHGTHCSSIAAGTGEASDGKYCGAAPEAKLYGIKVLDGNGSGSFTDVILGIQRAVELKQSGKVDIDIISMSLGGPISQPSKKDPVVQAVDAAWDAGIIVNVAAGNSGPGRSTTSTPANSDKILTVGAMDDKGTVKREDDSMAYFSSVGPTKYDGLVKPDYVAPGVNIRAADAFDLQGYLDMSGTSMSTPFGAGCTADVVSAAKSVGKKISHDEYKQLLLQTCVRLPDPKIDDNHQGKGAIDPLAMVNIIAPPDAHPAEA